jgi:negative regulator of sigma-B (phosphoserine phosphatase)
VSELEIGTAQRPIRGERVCGDAFVIVPQGGTTTIALADGLGHGEHAAQASNAFCSYVKGAGHDSLEEIFWGAHRSIVHTRGAAAALLAIDTRSDTLAFAGVGNIDFVADSATRIKPISTPGIVGQRIRKIATFSYPISAGDLFIVFSDGISGRFELKGYRRFSPSHMAAAILADYGKDHDVATCIVIRCR